MARPTPALFASLAAFLAFACPSEAVPRQDLFLNGEWQTISVASLDDPIPADGWKPFTVPGVIRGHDYERAWFRREFAIPDDWKCERVLLRFGGVKYNSRVLVNGKNVDGCFNGYDAFELDITDAVRFGETNTLTVGVHDWTGIFAGEKVDFSHIGSWDAVRGAPRDRILSPIGGHYQLYGIWDDVTLRAVPGVRVSEIVIEPSVRKSRIDFRLTVTNSGSDRYQGRLEVRVYAWDGSPRDARGQWQTAGDPVCRMPAQAIEIAPGETAPVNVRLERPPLKLWWPHDPRLYIVEARLSGADVLTERFGYRELWTSGPDFYLNGAKTHLLATSWWPAMPPLPRAQVVEQIRAIKAMNCTTFRTHTQPWPELWYEVADEMGLMMIPEGAIWNDDECYRVEDVRFWDNYADHLTAMVRTLRNHPSVVMWSLENEFWGSRAKDDTTGEEGLARMGRAVKALDPTRPITFESDGDPGGTADVIGIHYPNEYPGVRLWPDAGWWLDEARQLPVFWDGKPFRWDHEKPLYIGEYLWVPSATPASHTLFFGDEAYADHRAYRTKAKAESWRMQMLAYRSQGVSGQSPWTVIEQGPLDDTNPCYRAHRDMYRPLAAFFREFDSRFHSGETVGRTVELFNDTFTDKPSLRLCWTILDGSRGVSGREVGLVNLASGDHKKLQTRITMPKVTELSRLTLRLTLHSGGAELFREDYAIQVFPKASPAPRLASKLSIFDPSGTLPSSVRRGVGGKVLKRLEDWDGNSVLVVAPNALPRRTSDGVLAVIGASNADESRLSKLVSAGGRVLVLEQASDAPGLPVTLTDQKSTMAFPQMPSHPILTGITREDLRWWRGDHIVSANEPTRPQSGAMLPLVVTGSEQGISHSPLMEVPQGKGVWLICQLKVASKLDREPMARVLLDRMLAYLDTYSSSTCRTFCQVSPGLREQLESLGVQLDGAPSRLGPSSLLIIQSDCATVTRQAAELRSFMESGGRVLWHRPQDEGFSAAMSALGLTIDRQPYAGPAHRADGDDPLLESIAREDLYWTATPGNQAPWAAHPLATDTAEAVFSQVVADISGTTIEAEEGMRPEAPRIEPRDGHAAFHGGGRASWKISIPEAGLHVLGMRAWGTPARGAYPIAAVYLDDRLIGHVGIGSGTPQTYAVPFTAEAGAHTLAVTFTNDEYHGPAEDRNLFIDWFRISPDASEPAFTALTVPPALVEAPIGKGALILSSIRWDEAGRNAQRARRFIGALLTGLGAGFARGSSFAVVQAEAMTPDPKMPWFRKTSDHAQLNCNGHIEGRVRVERAGAYDVRVWAKGSPAKGVYPMLAIEADGKPLATIECASDDWAPHRAAVTLPAGVVNLRLRFTNDLSVPPEDRNIWIDRVEFEPTERPGA